MKLPPQNLTWEFNNQELFNTSNDNFERRRVSVVTILEMFTKEGYMPVLPLLKNGRWYILVYCLKMSLSWCGEDLSKHMGYNGNARREMAPSMSTVQASDYTPDYAPLPRYLRDHIPTHYGGKVIYCRLDILKCFVNLTLNVNFIFTFWNSTHILIFQFNGEKYLRRCEFKKHKWFTYVI